MLGLIQFIVPDDDLLIDCPLAAATPQAIFDIDEYNLLLKHKLANLPRVDNMESMFVMSQDKCETAFKL